MQRKRSIYLLITYKTITAKSIYCKVHYTLVDNIMYSRHWTVDSGHSGVYGYTERVNYAKSNPSIYSLSPEPL